MGLSMWAVMNRLFSGPVHDASLHASSLNISEIQLGILGRQCLGRSAADSITLAPEVAAWQRQRNAAGTTGRLRVPKKGRSAVASPLCFVSIMSTQYGGSISRSVRSAPIVRSGNARCCCSHYWPVLISRYPASSMTACVARLRSARSIARSDFRFRCRSVRAYSGSRIWRISDARGTCQPR